LPGSPIEFPAESVSRWPSCGARCIVGGITSKRFHVRAPVVRHVIVALASVLVAAATMAQPALSVSDIATIDAGRQLVREERIAGSPWPRVTIRQFVAASPIEAVALFADYPRHPAYLPGIKSASISMQASPTVAEVNYLLDVPLFPDESYTVRDSLSRSADGASYRVDWVMVRARSTKSIVGSARFEPHRNARSGVDGTLLTYDNLVVPGQALAGPLKGRALSQVRQTVTAIVAEIERVRRGEPGLLASQVDAINRALRDVPASVLSARISSAPPSTDPLAGRAPADRLRRSSSPRRASR
jgi:hypothetical protein